MRQVGNGSGVPLFAPEPHCIVSMNDWIPCMQKAVRHLADQLAGIRPGTLSIGFVETFRVTTGNGTFSLGKIASITRQANRIAIAPFDPGHVQAIIKSLSDAKLNAYAANPRTVVLSVPPPSGEQRQELARHVKKLGDEAKLAIRMIRQDARKQIAARGRGSERAVQEATDAAVEAIDRMVRAKMADVSA